jgi:hypothetical protein
MSSSRFETMRPILALALVLATGGLVYAHQDPPGCTGSGVSITITAFECSDATLASCTIPPSGTNGPVIVGEHIAYQATLQLPAGKCAFQAGTINIVLPNGSAVDVSSAGTCTLSGGGSASCDMATTCVGCTTAVPAGTTLATEYFSPKVPYQVAAADDKPAGCNLAAGACSITATTNYGGSGGTTAGVLHAGATDTIGPSASTSTPLGTLGCSGTIDKQVSCDGGTTWNDITGGDDSTGASDKGCIAQAGANVQFQFIAKNTGGTSIQCTLSDNVSTILPSQSITLGGGVTTTVSGTTQQCNLTAGQSGDDTATLDSCTCTSAAGVVVPGTGGTDTATYGCCGVQVDKQVSCTNGVPTGTQDTGFVSGNEDGTNGCSTTIPNAVSATYQVKNTGNVPLVCSGTGNLGGTLGFVDTFVVNSQSTFTGSAATIAAGAISGPFTDTNITQCSSTLNTNESEGDKLTAACECQASGTFNNNVSASAFDIAQIQCSSTPPNFTVTKTCTPVAGVAGSFTADVKVTNLDTVNPLSCQITDQYVTGACGTAPACPVSGGTPVTLTGLPLVVPVSSSADATGSITGLAATACNQACGSCSNGVACSTAADCPAFAGTTAACVSSLCTYTPTLAAQAECPVGSCFERTPGYWGTHPQVTQTLLPLTVCGQLLTATSAGVPQSATENLCESGKDFKQSSTTPQQLQLIRQCTSAALNLAASGKGGGLSSGLAACEAADPGISATFNNCCVGPGSTCDSSASSGVINASSCITLLDAFNSLDQGDFSTVNLTNSPAQPRQCQAANGNGLTNCTTGQLGGTIACGTK